MSAFWVLIIIGIIILIIDIIILLKLMENEKEGKISSMELNLIIIVLLLGEFIVSIMIYGSVIVDIPSYNSYSTIHEYINENYDNLDMNELHKELKKTGDDIEILSIDKLNDNNLNLKIKVNGNKGLYTNYKFDFVIKDDKIEKSLIDIIP